MPTSLSRAVLRGIRRLISNRTQEEEAEDDALAESEIEEEEEEYHTELGSDLVLLWESHEITDEGESAGVLFRHVISLDDGMLRLTEVEGQPVSYGLAIHVPELQDFEPRDRWANTPRKHDTMWLLHKRFGWCLPISDTMKRRHMDSTPYQIDYEDEMDVPFRFETQQWPEDESREIELLKSQCPGQELSRITIEVCVMADEEDPDFEAGTLFLDVLLSEIRGNATTIYGLLSDTEPIPLALPPHPVKIPPHPVRPPFDSNSYRHASAFDVLPWR